MTKEILLTQGKIVFVDEEDYERIKNIKFHAHYEGGEWYAIHSVNPKTQIRMHRLILGLKEGEFCDHINGNGLDNRKSNLRICTHHQNTCNRTKSITFDGVSCSSKYKGVTWHKQLEKWQTQIVLNDNHNYLGVFQNEVDAARAYDKAAIELFEEYTKLNFPEYLEAKKQ